MYARSLSRFNINLKIKNNFKCNNYFNYEIIPFIVKNKSMSSDKATDKFVEKSIRQKLKTKFNPLHLDVINESFMHNVPEGSETHFKVVIVSDKFDNISLLQRHRMVNEILHHELENGVHALSIVAKSPSQWNDQEKIKPSPKCLGGFGK